MHINRTPLTLKNLFELRKTKPLNVRRAMGRLFYYQGAYGLADGTGCVWPVKFAKDIVVTNKDLKFNDVLLFESSVSSESECSMGKYDDEKYLICIENILQVVTNAAEWSVEGIPCPVPDLSRVLPGSEKKQGTSYYESPTSQRMQRFQQRTTGSEKPKQFFSGVGFRAMETPSWVPAGVWKHIYIPFLRIT